ncbi:MAG: hypothetical protein HZB29_13215 [Nitrospinae bacterium]|nr:hypothetical protein [Nitrospinota bacterium]
MVRNLLAAIMLPLSIAGCSGSSGSAKSADTTAKMGVSISITWPKDATYTISNGRTLIGAVSASPNVVTPFTGTPTITYISVAVTAPDIPVSLVSYISTVSNASGYFNGWILVPPGSLRNFTISVGLSDGGIIYGRANNVTVGPTMSPLNIAMDPNVAPAGAVIDCVDYTGATTTTIGFGSSCKCSVTDTNANDSVYFDMSAVVAAINGNDQCTSQVCISEVGSWDHISTYGNTVAVSGCLPDTGPSTAITLGCTATDSRGGVTSAVANIQTNCSTSIAFDYPGYVNTSTFTIDGYVRYSNTTPFQGVTVYLCTENNYIAGCPTTAPGLATATTLTDVNGYFVFNNVAPGTYAVGVDLNALIGSGYAAQWIIHGPITWPDTLYTQDYKDITATMNPQGGGGATWNVANPLAVSWTGPAESGLCLATLFDNGVQVYQSFLFNCAAAGNYTFPSLLTAGHAFYTWYITIYDVASNFIALGWSGNISAVDITPPNITSLSAAVNGFNGGIDITYNVTEAGTWWCAAITPSGGGAPAIGAINTTAASSLGVNTITLTNDNTVAGFNPASTYDVYCGFKDASANPSVVAAATGSPITGADTLGPVANSLTAAANAVWGVDVTFDLSEGGAYYCVLMPSPSAGGPANLAALTAFASYTSAPSSAGANGTVTLVNDSTGAVVASATQYDVYCAFTDIYGNPSTVYAASQSLF